MSLAKCLFKGATRKYLEWIVYNKQLAFLRGSKGHTSLNQTFTSLFYGNDKMKYVKDKKNM